MRGQVQALGIICGSLRASARVGVGFVNWHDRQPEKRSINEISMSGTKIGNRRVTAAWSQTVSHALPVHSLYPSRWDTKSTVYDPRLAPSPLYLPSAYLRTGVCSTPAWTKERCDMLMLTATVKINSSDHTGSPLIFLCCVSLVLGWSKKQLAKYSLLFLSYAK